MSQLSLTLNSHSLKARLNHRMSSVNHMPWSRALRRSAWLLATLAMAGQLFSVVHFALVRHVACAEHGELIEAGAAVAGAAATTDHTTVGATAVETHGHDHCAVALLRRQQVRQSAAARPLLRLAVIQPTALVDCRQSPPPPIALLAVAPKNSPTI